MKLRTRVAFAVASVTIGALTTAFVAILLLVQRDEMTDLDRALSTQASLAARLAGMDDPTHPVIEPGSAEVPEHYEPSPQYIAVYGPQERIRTATPNFNGHAPSFADLGIHGPVPRDGFRADLRVRGERLRAVVVPMPAQGFSLLYAASEREVDQDVAFLARVLGVLLFAVTAVVTIVASWLGRRLAKDVQQLASLAREVARGDLSARAGEGVSGSQETIALAADLDHMIKQLSVLVAAQRTFISHAAHELMSPLATLRGELQLALRRPHTLAEHEETISQSLEDVQSLIALSEDLLTLARVESAEAVDQEARVGDVIADASRASKGTADSRRVRVVETRTPPNDGGTKVLGPRRELSRALRNLIDNAILHSNPGTAVRVGVQSTSTNVRIVVEDGGPGVPDGDRDRIFEPFFRGARERAETDQGTGLGLAIARQIARRSGGDVELDPSFAPGARFVLSLTRRSA